MKAIVERFFERHKLDTLSLVTNIDPAWSEDAAQTARSRASGRGSRDLKTDQARSPSKWINTYSWGIVRG